MCGINPHGHWARPDQREGLRWAEQSDRDKPFELDSMAWLVRADGQRTTCKIGSTMTPLTGMNLF